MSGEQKSYSQLQLEKLTEKLDDFNVSLGLGNLFYDPVVETILSFSYDQLNNMDDENKSLYAFKLEQYALFLQQKQNRARNIASWAKHNISIIVAKESKNYGDKYTKYDEKWHMIVSHDSYAKVLYDIMLEADSKNQELEMVATRISNLSKILNYKR